MIPGNQLPLWNAMYRDVSQVLPLLGLLTAKSKTPLTQVTALM